MREEMRVVRADVLHDLSVLSGHVEASDGTSKFRIGRAQHFIVRVLLVAQRVQAFEEELEQSSEVLRGRRRHEYGAVSIFSMNLIIKVE